ncbi:MAG: DUF523 domain-containing protein [Lachnospiraceae bacterium]|nr:DUF523 domain-containing protein [Lachnospiraceae bacterium]
MKIMVSACLLGENCKYNGGNNRNEKVLKFIKGHEVISVCPEVMGGLPTPRVPSEILNGVVTNKEGIVVDKEFRKGAQLAFDIAVKENVDLVILQSRSPSCGSKQIYDGTFSKTLVEGQGIFAEQLLCAGIPMLDKEDL